MKRRSIVIYPFLFSINPILLLLAAFTSEVPLNSVVPAIFVLPLLSGFLYVGLFFFLKDVHRVGFIVFIAYVWFFYYGIVRLIVMASNISIAGISISQHSIFMSIWSLLFIFIGSNWIWHRVRSPESITMSLNVLTFILVGISIFRISLDLVPRSTLVRKLSTQDTMEERLLGNNKPDIYYIILDGYGRSDTLKTLYNFDNTELINHLESRGFYIAAQSRSNYIQTALSLASSLNFEYLTGLPPLPGRGQLIGLISHSRTMSLLESFGYTSVSFSSDYAPTSISNTDIFLTHPNIEKRRDLEAFMLMNSATIIFAENDLIEIPITRYRTHQATITYIFEQLAEIPKIPGPKIVFAHIIAPHPPFVFDKNGPIDPDEFYVLSDGDRYPGSREEYISKYNAQIAYINKELIKTIDAILKNSPNHPIIILQADHGPGVYLNWESVQHTCLTERFSIFSAFYMPYMNTSLYESITPVNSFRVILDTYFGTNFGIIQDRNYFSTWSKPYKFIDVSEVVDIPCNIP